MAVTVAVANLKGAVGVVADAGVKLLEVECADLEHKAHPALDKLTVRVGNTPPEYAVCLQACHSCCVRTLCFTFMWCVKRKLARGVASSDEAGLPSGTSTSKDEVCRGTQDQAVLLSLIVDSCSAQCP